MVFPSQLPENAINKNIKNTFVVADSETTGNHHVVDVGPNDSIYEHDGTFFLKNADLTHIRCLQAARHDAIELEAGVWEFGIQQEYDYLTESLRRVSD